MGVGLEPVEVRIEELTELQRRFTDQPGVNALLVEIQQLKQKHADKVNGVFVEQSNGDMIAEETFGDEYEEDVKPRGLTQNIIHVDDTGFLPDGKAPESLSVVGLNGFVGHVDGSREHMFAGHLTDEEMKEKLMAQAPVEDKDYLGAWTTGDKKPD